MDGFGRYGQYAGSTLPATIVQIGQPDPEPDKPAFNQHDASVAALILAKEKVNRELDQEFAAIRYGNDTERREVWRELQREVDPTLVQAVQAAQTALREAQTTVQSAQQRLDAHSAARPPQAADVPAWAKRRGELVDELEAYEGIASDAARALQQAQQRAQGAVMAVFERKDAALDGTLQRVIQEGQAQIAAARRTLEETEADVATKVNAAQAQLQRLRRHRP
jgi:hypothetical protein